MVASLIIMEVVLSNGQRDEYTDEGTVFPCEAPRIVKHIAATGSWAADAPWVVDR
ncbi:hypothetical protein OG978_33250 [Streptomyces sp. NBC_01591]|uniref:hypothetical protein n=1 Tax=Streptomyces sp. NBC_01591 TaxID=2975888 RepID=UPI002DDBB4E9|nr:hypothetical protein [Streptomyces sp. NBC_01591]WSD71834.1 hypothetical protein OG978_33250 [Streptomyces sp. NBC_01591]